MLYKALYRKYRPNIFDEVAGQQYIIKILKNAVIHNRISHAYLFSGPRGTGKTSLAKIFAKAVNCEFQENGNPCMECDNCLAITNGSHPDFIEIDAASNNGVDEIRNLIEKVKYAPIKSKYKVYVIDEVHMMTVGAFNALLKTLEEPPSHIVFILATTEPHKILHTITSRCQNFYFEKVEKKEMCKRLTDVLNKELVEYEDKVLDVISEISDGGMRDALSTLDQCISYCGQNLKYDDIREIFGILSDRDVYDLFCSIIQCDYTNALKKVNEYYDSGVNTKNVIQYFIEVIKESITFEYCQDYTLLKLLKKENVKYINEYLSLDNKIQILDLVTDYLFNNRNKTSNKVQLDILLFKIFGLLNDSKIESDRISVSRETHKCDIKEKIELENNKKDNNISLMNTKIEGKESLKQRDYINEIESFYDEEFILSLLVGASKEERLKDEQLLQNLLIYENKLQWIKYVKLLKKVTIIASSETYILLNVGNKVESNILNEYSVNDLEFDNLFELLIKKRKKVICIYNDLKKVAIQVFKERLKTNSLPASISFEIKQKKEIKTTSKELVKELFGNNVNMEE